MFQIPNKITEIFINTSQGYTYKERVLSIVLDNMIGHVIFNITDDINDYVQFFVKKSLEHVN